MENFMEMIKIECLLISRYKKGDKQAGSKHLEKYYKNIDVHKI